jgi:phosphoglucomutase/phosphomannomutase
MTKEDRLILERYSHSEIDDAFFKDIEFGTAGMRGIMGPGSNRINP